MQCLVCVSVNIAHCTDMEHIFLLVWEFNGLVSEESVLGNGFASLGERHPTFLRDVGPLFQGFKGQLLWSLYTVPSYFKHQFY